MVTREHGKRVRDHVTWRSPVYVMEQSTQGRQRKRIKVNHGTTIAQRAIERHVHEAVDRKIDECPYGFIFKNVSRQYAEGRLTLRGCVPSFYLKQVLQELMQDVDQVEQVANHVDVVNSAGVSSEPPSKPR